MLDQPVRDLEDVRFIHSVRPRQRGRVVWQVIVVSVVVMSASAAAYPFLPRTYLAMASVLVRATDQQGATSWDQSARDALDDNAIQTKLDILQSPPLQDDVIKSQSLNTDPEFNASLRPRRLGNWLAGIAWLAPWFPERHFGMEQVREAVTKALQVRRERKSYIIQFGYQTRDAIKSAAMANRLATAFLRDQLDRKRASHEQVLGALKERIQILEAKYHKDEQAERDFVVSSGLAHVGEHIADQRQLETLGTTLAEAHRREIETARRAQELEGLRASGKLDDTTEALASPLLLHLRERYVDLISGAGSINVPSGANTTVISRLHDDIATETQRLVHAAEEDARLAIQVEVDLGQQLRLLDGRLVLWEASERKRVDLHRAVTTSLAALDLANQRYNTEAGLGDLLLPDIEVITQADVPNRPSFPNTLIYAAGTISILVLLNGLLLLPTLMRVTSRDR